MKFTVRKPIHGVIQILQKPLKKCPRDAKTALGISGVGEG